ncbi:MAG: hypothetical protein RLZZ350_1934 [Verrucomicrobiota bacterium]
MNPQPELLPSLRRLVRGLVVLFWGLPVALIVCVQSGRGEALRRLDAFPAMLATGFLLFALAELGHFQPQERVWVSSLRRLKFLALVLVGLSPFLFWANRAPAENFFAQMTALLSLAAILFLAQLNLVLRRLVAMLPDETLRAETQLFTAVNRGLLLALLLLVAGITALLRLAHPPRWLLLLLDPDAHLAQPATVLLVLLPLALTMALLWKIKQAILDSVFAAKP